MRDSELLGTPIPRDRNGDILTPRTSDTDALLPLRVRRPYAEGGVSELSSLGPLRVQSGLYTSNNWGISTLQYWHSAGITRFF